MVPLRYKQKEVLKLLVFWIFNKGNANRNYCRAEFLLGCLFQAMALNDNAACDCLMGI